MVLGLSFVFFLVVLNVFYLFFFHQMEPPKEFGTFSALLAPALLSGKKNEEGETVRSRTSTLSRKAGLTASVVTIAPETISHS